MTVSSWPRVILPTFEALSLLIESDSISRFVFRFYLLAKVSRDLIGPWSDGVIEAILLFLGLSDRVIDRTFHVQNVLLALLRKLFRVSRV